MGADAPSDSIADIMHWIDAHPGENLQDLINISIILKICEMCVGARYLGGGEL